jgi:general secretion pathway protein F
MGGFRYRAVDPSGAAITGEIEAADEAAAIAALQARGVFPTDIVPAAADPMPATAAARAGTALRARDLALFTRQLASLTGAGIRLERALSLLAAGRGPARARRVAGELHRQLLGGSQFSAACASHRAFPPHFALVVAAGEARADTAGALDYLAALQERWRQTAQALVAALAYPAAVLVVGVATLAFLLVFFVQRFEPLLRDLGRALPLQTRILLGASDAAAWAAPAFALALAAMVALAAASRRDPRLALARDRFLLRLPLVGALLRQILAERIMVMLGHLLAARVEFRLALAATSAAIGNRVAAAALEDARAALERGEGPGAALANGDILPEFALELIRIGEETGDLPGMLRRGADLARREAEATTALVLGLVTPVSILALGLAIGAIIWGVFGSVLEVYDIAS